MHQVPLLAHVSEGVRTGGADLLAGRRLRWGGEGVCASRAAGVLGGCL